MTLDTDRRLLLDLARRTIVARATGAPAPGPARDGIFARRGGAFVTVHVDGALRGCIGHVEMTDPLGEVVAHCAVAASSEDPRFPPIAKAELDRMAIEISLLTPFEPIAGPDDIEVGRHGLIVERGWHRGLLLPQVATEWKWDKETFLEQTCVKAGLPRDAWKTAQLWRFEAEVFGERE